MGCGPKAAAMQEEEQYYEERMTGLRKVKPESWDSFLDEVRQLLDAVHNSNLMAIARNAVIVEDHMRQIRRVK